MERYSKLHLWMIILFLIVQISIFNYYWPTFTTESWEFHVHYWLVTAWYIFMILQPYFIVRGKIEKHRTFGIIGFLIAGGAIFTAISLLDFPLKLVENHNPERPGPPVSFYYGTLVVELVLIIAFAYAVVKGILTRKKLSEHSWWLICSAFYMMPPALGRGLIQFWRKVLPPENFNPMIVFVSAEIIYIPLLLLFAQKFGKMKHQATLIGIVLVVFRFLRVPIGSSEVVQEILKAFIKWQ
ncbi:MAG: hypothetical protein ABJN95_04890 [Maribacter sp.]|uniref:hypothetical protein n=1 Tax=Maribacter sp. TaxID=1897614 RepID=UPI00329A4F62